MEFELRMKGTLNNCKAFYNTISQYDGYWELSSLIGEQQSGDQYLYTVVGACTSSVYRTMMEAEESLEKASRDNNIEVEVFGGDIGDGDEFEHYYYKDGECLDCFNDPSYFTEDDEYAWEIDEETKAKYNHEGDYYILKSEYAPKAKWEDGELKAEFSIKI